MGSCTSTLKGITTELQSQLSDIEALLNSNLSNDIINYMYNIDKAYEQILSMNSTSFQSQYNKNAKKKIQMVTAKVLRSKADL